MCISSPGAATAAAGLVHNGGFKGTLSFVISPVRIWRCGFWFDPTHLGFFCMTPVIKPHAIEWEVIPWEWWKELWLWILFSKEVSATNDVMIGTLFMVVFTCCLPFVRSSKDLYAGTEDPSAGSSEESSPKSAKYVLPPADSKWIKRENPFMVNSRKIGGKSKEGRRGYKGLEQSN